MQTLNNGIGAQFLSNKIVVIGNEYLLSHIELKYFSLVNVKLNDIETE